MKELGIMTSWVDSGENTAYNMTWYGFRFVHTDILYIHCDVLLCVDHVDCNPFSVSDWC